MLDTVSNMLHLFMVMWEEFMHLLLMHNFHLVCKCLVRSNRIYSVPGREREFPGLSPRKKEELARIQRFFFR